MQLKYKETLSRQDLTAILTLTDAAEEFDGFHTSVQKDTDEDIGTHHGGCSCGHAHNNDNKTGRGE